MGMGTHRRLNTDAAESTASRFRGRWRLGSVRRSNREVQSPMAKPEAQNSRVTDARVFPSPGLIGTNFGAERTYGVEFTPRFCVADR